MNNKLAIISGFLGGTKNRYITYQPDRDLETRINMAKQAVGFSGLEICYPQDFKDPEQLKKLLKDNNLGVSAINFRSRRTGQWWRGSFSSAKKEERDEVVRDMCAAMDYAAELGAYRVTTCPLNEGHDYPFEMDYASAYDYMVETISKCADYRPDVKICIEYKQNDPRARCLLGNAGETIAFCQETGKKNVGATLDIGHAIQAGERPAQSAMLLHRANRLFYVHLNDNDKFWDWDMVPGAYNLFDFVEFLYTLDRIGYDDWFAFDVFPKENDTVEVFKTVAAVTRKLQHMAEIIDPAEIQKLQTERNPVAAQKYIYETLFHNV